MERAKCLLAMFLRLQFFLLEFAVFLRKLGKYVFHLHAFVVPAVGACDVRQKGLCALWAGLKLWGFEKNVHSPLPLPRFGTMPLWNSHTLFLYHENKKSARKSRLFGMVGLVV